MHSYRLKGIVFLLLLNWASHLMAQQTVVNTQVQYQLQIATELFEKQKYAAAQRAFETITNNYAINTEEHAEAMYYSAVCSIELFNADAETRMLKFIELYPGSKRIKMGYFSLGNLQYRNRSYKEALAWYDKIESTDLPAGEVRSEYKFKKGYCYFLRNEYAKAKVLFNDIKDVENSYAAPASYYFSHIAYSEGNLETALNGFEKFKPGSPFYPTVPYYISHIYYMQKKYTELIDFALPWMDSANVKRAPELARLVGDAYFRKEKYAEALPYLNKFFDKGSKPNREDYYQIAYCYYKTNNYPKAIENYKKVIGQNDSLSQITYYQLADSYIRTNEKQLARNCYEAASKAEFYPDLSEDALYSYAKLSYELSYNPYHEAIEAFDTYIATYPNSPRMDEAFQYMVNVYLTTKNYKEALVSIEKIKRKTLDMEFAYQKIAYYRAVELFNDRDYTGAVDLFEKAIKIGKDKKINAISIYWKADSYYRMDKFKQAADGYSDFLVTPGAALFKEFSYINYNIGYCYFKLETYEPAAVSFRKFIAEKNTTLKKMLSDANVRTGDCFYMKNDYNKAIDFYTDAIKLDAFDMDYALFQKAGALGLVGKTEEKIQNLEQLLSKFPKSSYNDDAKYEIGNAYMQRSNYEKALSYFNRLREDHPKSSYVKKALLKSALAYYNMDNDKEAIVQYKQIVALYPNSVEAKESFRAMRNIYVETGDVATFESYIKNQSGFDFSTAAIDSATYEAAELRFMKNDCELASNDFRAYMEKFPNGIFLLNANYYLAECVQQTDENQALTSYKYVISQNKNKFTENALLKAAALSYRQLNYVQALDFYEQLLQNAETPAHILDAKTGVMRSGFKTQNYEKALDYADKVVKSAKVSNELQAESYLIRGRSAAELGKDSLAIGDLIKTAKMSQNETGAQAHYYLAELYYKRANYPETERTIFELIDRVPSYDYWIAKGFILLAKNYTALQDDFQAKETLKSIIEKCEVPDLVKEAQEQLNTLEAKEQKRLSEIKEDEVEIKFDNQSPRDDKIFDSPIEQPQVPEDNE